MRARAAFVMAMGAAVAAVAAEPAPWPPSAEALERMKGLQAVIIDRGSSAAQRESAREELASMLKSPAGQSRGRATDEKPARPARAAVTDPIPMTVIPSPSNVVPMPGVARLEIVEPPRPVVDPRTGGTSLAQPSGFAIDPRTGNVIHPVPGGGVDPRTGQFTPR